MKFARYILIFLISFCVNVSHSEPVPLTFSVDFSAYALRPINTKNLYFKNANGSLSQIEFTPKSRSQPYTATLRSDDRLLHFYRKQATSDGAITTKIGQVTLKPTDTNSLLIFLQGESENDLKVYPIDDASRNFPLGSLCVVNITGVKVISKIDDSQLIIQHGEASIPILLGTKESTEVSIAGKSHDRFHLLYKNRIRITSGSRGILILRPPVRTGSLRIGGHLLLESPNEIKE